MANLDIITSRRSAVAALQNVYRPQFFRLTSDSDREELNQLLFSQPHILVFDEFHGQLAELIKSQHPTRKFTPDQLEIAVREYLNEIPQEEYGVWVYYPWSARLVHILDEKEFIDLRTSRNQYKITRTERDTLARKKVGVVGLSVGQSVAVTMAMERGCGEIRLADFDLLELTNLNRIRTGVHNLGLPKVISVAREIAEIDPFLRVVCFTDGLTETNMADFFTQGGKLDLLVEECDGLDIKITCRYMARQLRIPVVMEASDRCLLDVERFDREPDRPILHGLIGQLSVEKLKTLKTNEEKIPYLLAMIGWEDTSARLKASMLEIEQTITTWPQLASAVTLGGGLTADVVRRILLDQYHESGRYYVDVEELVGNKNNEIKKAATPNANRHQPRNFTELEEIATAFAGSADVKGVELSVNQIEHLVEVAIQAPSAGNNQPWKWLYRRGHLFLFRDAAKSYQFGDYGDQATYTALGAALENLTMAARRAGYQLLTTYFPVAGVSELVTSIQFEPLNPDAYPDATDYLFNYIGMRQTDRQRRGRKPVEKQHLDELKAAAATMPGVALEVIQSPVLMEVTGEIIAAAERIRFLHPEGHREVFEKEIRWNAAQAQQTRDGLDLAAFELTPSEEAGFRVAKDPKVIALLNQWEAGKGFEKLARKTIASASAIGLLTIPDFSPQHFLKGGRAAQRIWLTATSLGLTLQPLTAPVYLFARLLHGNGQALSEKAIAELRERRTQFEEIFPVVRQRSELFLFRVTVADQPAVKSLRRPVAEVLHF